MAVAYDEQAGDFAKFAPESFTFAHIEKPAYKKFLTIHPDFKCLDIGAGSGRIAKMLIERGAKPENITGVEISANLVEIAKRDVPGVNFVCGDAREPIGIADGTLDLVTSHMVLEFFDEEGLAQVLATVYRLLKPGGVFCSITTNPHKMKLKEGLERPGWFQTKSPWGAKIDNWYRTKTDFTLAFKAADLSLLILQDLHVPPESEPFNPERYAFVKRLDPMRLMIVAVKR
jgi:ubiquinone/menaquinone biosynthesis C-methylase UbiE